MAGADGTDVIKGIEFLQFNDVTISSVNTAPTSNDDVITVAEDSITTLDSFQFSDIDCDSLGAIEVTADISAGKLQHDTSGAGDWVNTTLGQEIDQADLSAGRLRFIPETNANGDNYASFTFKVSDGKDLSSRAYTRNINVTPVNDAPVINIGEIGVIFTEGDSCLLYTSPSPRD